MMKRNTGGRTGGRRPTGKRAWDNRRPKTPENLHTEVPKEVVEQLPPVPEIIAPKWVPKTEVGKKVRSQEIMSIDEILDAGLKIMEPEIVDCLVQNLETDLFLIGQAKGKFGGGQRRIFRQTQKKSPEGNKPHFGTFAVCGNRNGYVGIGYGKSKETVPAREKAFRNAKTTLIKVRRGCGSWECGCREPHSIPFAVRGKVGSAEITLYPAPKGTGLKVESECQKLLALAGIRDARSQTLGQTRTKINLVKACFAALQQLMATKVHSEQFNSLGIVEGRITATPAEKMEKMEEGIMPEPETTENQS